MALYLIRHGAVSVAEDATADSWHLSQEGADDVRLLAEKEPGLGHIDVFYSSPESKTVETASILAGVWNQPVIEVDDLRELDRGTRFLTDYELVVERAMENPALPAAEGWETVDEARRRISTAISQLLDEDERNIGVVSHGIVLSLFMGYITGTRPFDIWQQLTFPDVAVIDWPRKLLLLPFGALTARH